MLSITDLITTWLRLFFWSGTNSMHQHCPSFRTVCATDYNSRLSLVWWTIGRYHRSKTIYFSSVLQGSAHNVRIVGWHLLLDRLIRNQLNIHWCARKASPKRRVEINTALVCLKGQGGKAKKSRQGWKKIEEKNTSQSEPSSNVIMTYKFKLTALEWYYKPFCLVFSYNFLLRIRLFKVIQSAQVIFCLASEVTS